MALQLHILLTFLIPFPNYFNTIHNALDDPQEAADVFTGTRIKFKLPKNIVFEEQERQTHGVITISFLLPK